jgi:hypothetical protein
MEPHLAKKHVLSVGFARFVERFVLKVSAISTSSQSIKLDEGSKSPARRKPCCVLTLTPVAVIAIEQRKSGDFEQARICHVALI